MNDPELPSKNSGEFFAFLNTEYNKREVLEFDEGEISAGVEEHFLDFSHGWQRLSIYNSIKLIICSLI